MPPHTKRSTLALALAMALAAGCSANTDEDKPFQANMPLANPQTLFDGHPGNDALPDDNKADAVYPARFTEIVDLDSPVKSQGQRGICSIFATVGLMEQLYNKSGILSDPDFSEQYLQWSVKFEMGRFTHSSGSNLAVNLATIADHGIVTEEMLPYDDHAWNTSDDPACTGEEGPTGQPTYCYTNGEPSVAALAARKWRLPAGRWLNTNSIKAHMMTHKTGVAVALEFYRHSWHFHRGNRAQWAKGFVTYPNAQDKVASKKKPGGHAVLLVGWDDELEVQLRDYDTGQLLYDESGDPVTEKGFYIFKNSWGTDSFGAENPYGAGYGFISMAYVEEFGVAYVSQVPRPVAQREVCTDGDDNDGDGKTDCDDPDCDSLPLCAPVLTYHAFRSDDELPIPDNDPDGVASTILVEESGVIASVTVEPDIVHPYSGDLEITLTHGETSVTLHRWGELGNFDWFKKVYRPEEFIGANMAGEWQLTIKDKGRDDKGTLHGWSLEIVTR